MTALSVLVVGLLLGMAHATEADHLAAVATLATRQDSLGKTVRQGVAWGIGHTSTLMLFGGLVFALGRSVPAGIERGLEAAVGVMLIVLGADVLRRLARERIHFHVHRHGPQTEHVHAHGHRGEGPHERSTHDHAHAPRQWPLRALAVGMMHGLAGSAALVVLGMQSSPSLTIGLGTIALFGVGSIAGMALLSVAIAWPLKVSAGYLVGLHRGLKTLIGGFSCALGVWVIVGTGVLHG